MMLRTKARVLVSALLVAAAMSMAMFVFAPVQSANSGPALTVSVAANRHAISPDIYGMNFANPTLAQELRLPVDRWGGNATSRYNWTTNVHNTGSDYYYENIASGQTTDQFVDADRAHGTKPIITVPLIGYVSKASPANHPFFCGFSVAHYGAQQETDPYDADCGNGRHTDGTAITGNDPLKTSVATDESFVQNWVAHFVTQYGAAVAGGIPYYDLDNEPVLWDSTHRDVHPSALTYDELESRTTTYAAAVKAGDPTAKTLGPSDWGWLAYFDTNVAGDRAAHGNVPLGQWYLQRMKAYEQLHGARILDYFDEHFYPQGSNVAIGPAGDAATQALRLRSTRALWDNKYTDESWIGQVIRAIPLFHSWIDGSYPGTRLSIGEYNWGGLESINGALAEADVLGIFGRERVDLATMWAPPTTEQPGAFAFRMYRNYDGAGGSFGDIGVQSTSADQGQLAIYGAQRSADGAVTLMVINKTGSDLRSALSLAGWSGNALAQVYAYSPANLHAVIRQADLPVGQGGFTATYTANTITLVVLTPSANPLPPSPRSSALPLPSPAAPLPMPRPTVPIIGLPAPVPGRR
ncbi:MAG: glycoside hydrolase family 44 protein [Chloroflexota bacterium]|nr:glycoside hydrolase family 44 protein [Chloroflexota bacterium]